MLESCPRYLECAFKIFLSLAIYFKWTFNYICIRNGCLVINSVSVQINIIESFLQASPNYAELFLSFRRLFNLHHFLHLHSTHVDFTAVPAHFEPLCRRPKTLHDRFVRHCLHTFLSSNKFLHLSTFFAASVVYSFCVTPSTCAIVYFIPTAVIK